MTAHTSAFTPINWQAEANAQNEAEQAQSDLKIDKNAQEQARQQEEMDEGDRIDRDEVENYGGSGESGRKLMKTEAGSVPVSVNFGRLQPATLRKYIWHFGLQRPEKISDLGKVCGEHFGLTRPSVGRSVNRAGDVGANNPLGGVCEQDWTG